MKCEKCQEVRKKSSSSASDRVFFSRIASEHFLKRSLMRRPNLTNSNCLLRSALIVYCFFLANHATKYSCKCSSLIFSFTGALSLEHHSRDCNGPNRILISRALSRFPHAIIIGKSEVRTNAHRNPGLSVPKITKLRRTSKNIIPILCPERTTPDVENELRFPIT